MTFWMIIRNSLRQHALSTAITAASIGLGCGLLMAVWVVNFQTQREFKNVTGGFDCILGQTMRADTHTVLTGRVQAVRLNENLEPLLYSRGEFGSFAR